MSLNAFRLSFPCAARGDWSVMQGHADYCATYGHATLNESTDLEGNTTHLPWCARCGEREVIPEPSTHDHATGRYTDSRTTITYGPRSASIWSRYANSTLSWWRLPDSATFRKWIDADLKGTGLKRSGRIALMDSNINGSRYVVDLVPIRK